MLGKVIDVVIGMTFTYFLLASVAAAIQEFFAGIFKWRGSYLSKGIDVILDDTQSGGFRWNLPDFFIAHFSWKVPKTASERSSADSNTSSQEKPAAQEKQAAMRKVLLSVQSHPLLRGTPSAVPSYVPAHNFALALLDALRDGTGSSLMTQVKATISTLPDGDLKRTLSLFDQKAGEDLDKFQAYLETWFDDAMDRLSGIYKRLSQYIMLILGIAIAVSCNLDSLRLARTLWQEDALRNATVASASQLLDRIPKPSSTPDAATEFDFNGSLDKVGNQMKVFEDEHLPFGWPGAPGWFPATMAGWIATALAIALGGPFWFSLLQQLTNIRTAGPEPARSQPKLS